MRKVEARQAALDADLAAVCLGYALDNGQPKSRAGRVAPRRLASEERFEDPLMQFWRDSRPPVSHLDD